MAEIFSAEQVPLAPPSFPSLPHDNLHGNIGEMIIARNLQPPIKSLRNSCKKEGCHFSAAKRERERERSGERDSFHSSREKKLAAEERGGRLKNQVLPLKRVAASFVFFA